MDQLRYFKKLTLEDALKKPFGNRSAPIFISKEFSSDHEYLWDKVQRERAEDHPKYKGGRHIEVDYRESYHFRVTAFIGDNPKNRPAGSTDGTGGCSVWK